MRKILLAKLSNDECEEILESERLLNTFKTLLQNSFLCNDEHELLKEKIKRLKLKIKMQYSELFQKHDIPYLLESNYYISPETSELYTEL